MSNHSTSTHIPASFMLRLLAILIDVALFVQILAFFIHYASNQATLPEALGVLFIFVLAFALNPLFYLSSIFMIQYLGGTLGKLVTGIRITDNSGDLLSFKRSFFRETVACSFSWIFFGLGFLAMIKHPEKLTWQDEATGSRVQVIHHLWPAGIAALIILIGGSAYLFTASINTFIHGPLLKESKMLYEQMQQQPVTDEVDNEIYEENPEQYYDTTTIYDDEV